MNNLDRKEIPDNTKKSFFDMITYQMVVKSDEWLNKVKKNKSTDLEVDQALREEFDQLFNGQSLKNKISIEEYLERIQKVELLNGIVFQIASYLFFRIISIPGLFKNFKESNYAIKLFGTCIYTAQKFHLDIQFSPHDIGKLVGLKTRSLNQKEIFIVAKLLKFDIKITKEQIIEFRKKMFQIYFFCSN